MAASSNALSINPYQGCEHGCVYCYARPSHSYLVTRDLDLLAELAELGLCSVAISIPTQNNELKRVMEPRVPAASARLKAMAVLAEYGVPTSALIAPVIPALNDGEIEAILEAVAGAGASQAHYILLRLPHEVLDIFTEWLMTHFPDRKERVLSLVRQASGGRNYDARFGVRQTGRGAYAGMLASRFRTASRKLGLDAESYQHALDCNQFVRPGAQQLGLDF